MVRARDLLVRGTPVPPDAPQRAGWLIDPALIDPLRARLRRLVRARARADPLDPGVPVEVARRVLDLPDARLLELVSGGLVVRDGRVHHADTAPGLPDDVEQAVTILLAELSGRPFDAPLGLRLTELGLGPRQLAAAARVGRLVRLADGIYLAPESLDLAVAALRGLPQPFTVGDARDVLDSSRRVLIPLLELLAARGLTRRDDEGTHRVLRPATTGPPNQGRS